MVWRRWLLLGGGGGYGGCGGGGDEGNIVRGNTLI